MKFLVGKTPVTGSLTMAFNLYKNSCFFAAVLIRFDAFAVNIQPKKEGE